MEYAEFDACLAWWSDREENSNAWKILAADVLNYDERARLVSANLDIKNPNSLEALEHRPPEELIADMLEKEKRVMGVMNKIQAELGLEK